MAIDFNTSPYYDDFDKANNFYRILFKPGRSVQARELTQLQTILQNQIEQFGKNIFKDGTVVVGGKTFISGGVFLKLTSTDASLSTYESETIVGATSSARGIVRKVQAKQTISGTAYPDIFHVAMVSGVFTPGEIVSIENTNTTATLDSSGSFQGATTFFSIDESIFFVKGFFVFCEPQTIVLSPTLVTAPSARAGLEITESITTSDNNETLLDPAIGASNYFAPGADRYSIDLTLTSIEYDPDVEDSNTTDVDEFIEVVNVRRGELISVLKNTQYAYLEDTLARRTFDESGDYTVTPFTVKVRDHIYGNTSKLTLEVSPGKAYVRGYEFETIAPTYLSFDRAQDTESVNNFPVAIDYGRYVTINTPSGFFNPFVSQRVDIHSTDIGNVNYSSNATYYSSVIGSARVRYLDKATASTYNLYLFDLDIKTGNTFSEAEAFVATASENVISSSNVVAQSDVTGNATINYGVDDSLLFVLPQERIKSFKDNIGVTDTSYNSQKLFTSVTFSPSGGYSNATVTLSGTEVFIGSGVLSDDAINARFFGAVTATTNTSTFPVNTVLDFNGVNGQIEITSSQTAVLTVVGNDSFTANISALHTTSTAASKTKTLTSGSLVVSAGSNVDVISLSYPDVVGVSSIIDAQGNSYLGSYVLDTGQRDDYYDHGRLILKSGTIGPVLNSTTNPNVTIAFQHFTHSGTGYFDVDSYTSAGISYPEIPVYKNSKGEIVNLSDAIDFRAVRAAGSNTIISSKVIEPGSTVTADYSYYLPRIDKLVLTKERKFVIAEGAPSQSPVPPTDFPDGMTLYTISLPAYTASPNEVTTSYFDHKRFTMRDIGKIEKRVDRLEYYSALSLLEKIAADERIASDIPGIDRFKNGILVDAFAGHSVGDVNNGDYKCSIDFENRTLRPMCVAESLEFTVDDTNSSGYVKTGDLITANYITTPYISQLKATRDVNLTPFEVFSWIGRMNLEPATDTWADTINNGTVTVNLNGANDAFTQITLDNRGLSPWGTKWNSWQTVFRGVTDVGVTTSARTTVANEVAVDKAGNMTVTPTARTSTSTSTTVTTAEAQARTGLQFMSASKTITTSLGTKVVDTSVIPYIRTRPVKFYAKSLKPNTQLFATFDEIDVTSYCRPGVEIVFTSNTVPTTKVTTVTHSSGWSGDVILQKADRIWVIPDTTYRLVESGNTISFSNTVVSLTVNNINTPNTLTTNQSGDVAGVFLIPNNSELKFNIGERAFKLTDSLNRVFETTAAETKYLAYGISNTKEDTVLATRINLVSVNPMLSTRQTGSTKSTTTTTNRGVDTTGLTNTVALPPTQQVTQVTQNITNNIDIINNVTQNVTNITNLTNVINNTNITQVNNNVVNNNILNVATQTIFCGQTARASGRAGVHTFLVNLGNTAGRGNVVVTSAGIPDKFTLEYGGKISTSGFMTSESSSSASVQLYNSRLKDLGYGEVTRFNTGTYKLPFFKQNINSEFATILVEAPIPGTAWSLYVECPSGAVSADPGTAVMIYDNPGNAPVDLVANFDRYWGAQLRYSAAVAGTVPITITNTAANPKWTITGNDKTVTITAINITLPDGSTGFTATPTVSGSVRTITTGTHNFVSSASTGSNNPLRVCNLGSLPVTLQPGESRTFAISMSKTAAGIINGSVKVSLSLQGSNSLPIACNDIFIPIKTNVLFDTWVEDPIAQTFFVLEGEHPNGIFIPSIDVFFREKDNSYPVTCEIRPVINGFPSSGEVMPFAVAVVDNVDIKTSSTPDLTKNTRFTFPSPVYLPPGQYCFVLRANSNKFKVFSAVLGEFSLNNLDERITKQPYIGSMFKSQNASTWTPEQNEDLMFRVNLCSFDVNNQAVIRLNSTSPSSNVEYDVFYATGEAVDFAEGGITYRYKTTPTSTGSLDSTFTYYTLGHNVYMDQRKIVKRFIGDSLQFQVEMQTKDPKVSPVIDLNRISSVLVRNIINNDYTGEDGYSGGNSLARYITRRVTLSPGFEARDLKVYLNAFCPGSSSIKAYYKVNAPGTTDFQSQNKYVEFDSVVIDGNHRAGFGEYTFETTADTALEDGSAFNTFVVKIVMLSDDTTQVPIIRDLRVIALDE